MSGWRLRGYALERLLGRGASSEVWRARAVSSGDAVALKRLMLGDADQVRRAHAEAAVLTVLDHPNLVRLHEVIPTADAAVLVLDLADGGSLADVLLARGRLAPGEVITAIAPVAAALAYVHRRGVVHGDVSAGNVLFTPGGVALLADLGTARLTGDEADAESTPAYVDPAVAAGGVPAPASDVFMLAAVAFHALTGRPPWPGPDADAALDAARAGRLDDPDATLVAAGVPAAMAAVIARALALDPWQRGTAADLALDLRHSGTPIAVELTAGRERAEPPSEAGPGAVLETPRRSSARPPVSGYDPRHAAPPEAYGSPPPTRAVARPRPVLPQRPRRAMPRRRLLAGAVLAGLAGAGAVTATAAWPQQATTPRPVARHSTVVPMSAAPSSAAPSSMAAPRATPAPSPRVANTSGWPAALRVLAARRAAAFAARDPAGLRGVYLPGPLLDADAALVRRLVPTGCRLPGVVTRYEQVHVTVRPAGAVVTARASIPVTVLHCPRAPDRAVAAVGPALVRIELVRRPGGLRIAAQQVRAE